MQAPALEIEGKRGVFGYMMGSSNVDPHTGTHSAPVQTTPTTTPALQTVLIADDSQTERVNLSKILQSAGYEVISALSGNEATQLALKHTPDIIFLDILMEDGDGYKTCRQLKRSEQTSHIPVIMLSSKNNPVDIKWAKKLGAFSYITKPYTEQDILTQLHCVQQSIS